jgi:flagellar hook-associated protein 3 FlgL
MSIINTGLARVPDSMQMNSTMSSISKTQANLLQLENELDTGQQINTPSDNPAGATLIEQLNRTLSQNQSYLNNIQSASNLYSTTYTTLNGVSSDILNSAQTIASQNVGATATPTTRSDAAGTVQSLINQMLTLANTQFNGQYIFGGNSGSTAPFVANGNGIQYVGSTQGLSNAFDGSGLTPFTVAGSDAFSVLGGQVTGTGLSPGVTGNTLISRLGGATNNGVGLGSIQISDGTTTKTVNLSSASDLQDVVNMINAAGTDVTAAIGSDNQSLTLTAGGSDQISVKDIGAGQTAADLGILQSTPLAAGTPLSGQHLNAQVTASTLLSSLNGGAGISSAGLQIGDGTTTTTVNVPTSPTATVQDLLNAINSSATFVNASINSNGTGINVVNSTSGRSLTIGENGGTTATDLGIRSFSPTTPLADLNSGQGVDNVSGADFQISKHDGSVVSVDISGDTTVQDVINSINTAAGYTMASFSTTGNGIVLSDNSTGTGGFEVTSLNASTAASDLGIAGSTSSNTLTGTDANPVEATGIFADLTALQTALQQNDTQGITAAAQKLATDATQVSNVQGTAGAQAKAMQNQQSDLSAQNTSLQTMLSNVQEVNYTTAVSQFQELQTSLQAALEAAGQTIHESLLNFLST